MMVSAMQVNHPSCITAIPEVPLVTPTNQISPSGTKRKRMPGRKLRIFTILDQFLTQFEIVDQILNL